MVKDIIALRGSEQAHHRASGIRAQLRLGADVTVSRGQCEYVISHRVGVVNGHILDGGLGHTAGGEGGPHLNALIAGDRRRVQPASGGNVRVTADHLPSIRNHIGEGVVRVSGNGAILRGVALIRVERSYDGQAGQHPGGWRWWCRRAIDGSERVRTVHPDTVVGRKRGHTPILQLPFLKHLTTGKYVRTTKASHRAAGEGAAGGSGARDVPAESNKSRNGDPAGRIVRLDGKRVSRAR